MSPDPQLINDIAAELGISPAFVEKDWYSVQALKCIAGHHSDAFTTIFSGGTSLSKGYGLIQRFSEDLDFRCLALKDGSQNQMRGYRRDFKNGLLSVIEELDCVTLDRSSVEAASNYIKFPLTYPQEHSGHQALRPHLQLEFSFTRPRLEPELRPIQSLVAQFSGEGPEINVLCLASLETAADKLSALTWRVLKRDRNSSADDPTLVRHLHDLAALRLIVEQEKALFVQTSRSAFEEDQRSGRRDTAAGYGESLRQAADMLGSDDEYRTEYGQFVDAMSYASDADNISFDDALSSLERLVSFFEE